jgi:2,4-dienoyl-CoA reductase-like NADH-dependent reductase (Old Yellow Enzyme family)
MNPRLLDDRWNRSPAARIEGDGARDAMNLFESFELAGVRIRNRIGVSPMCQYSADNGTPTTWHSVHLGSRAVGGAGLVMTEATAVEARGRISPADTGIWLDSQAEAWAPIARFIAEQGAVPGMQLAHAGRKASTDVPWDGGKPLSPEDGGWRPIVAPSPLAFAEQSPVPAEMSIPEIDALVVSFADAARRAVAAGFQVVEIHGAHGYLLHEFLSPLCNQRQDEYGGSFENRIRIVRRVVAAVRAAIPERLPLLLRISATDWVGGGWDIEQSCALVQTVRDDGVTLIDVSSGGILPSVRIPAGPGYQTPLAAEIRYRTGVPTAAVGMIVAPEQADQIVRSGQADLIFLAREMLRDPYWPRRAAKALGAQIEAPKQYARAW